MRLLADENFPGAAVAALRRAGFDVLWVAEANPGIADEAILDLCASTQRTLPTFDKDFGELAYKAGLPAQHGVVLFRVTPQTPEEIAAIAVSVIRAHPDWAGRFGVITRHGVRIRNIPGPL